MEDKLVTLAILTYSKAQILKNVLDNAGIEATIYNVNLIQPIISSGVRVRIKESDLPQALQIVESSTWLSEDIVNEEDKEENKEKKHENIILIPIDFSDYSLKACKFGFCFANTIHAKIVLMHVYFSPIYTPTIPYGTDNLNIAVDREESIKSMLDGINIELKKLSDIIKHNIETGEYPDVEYKCILREGIPEEEILRYARNHHPQIIIMGTRGKSQKDFDLIGSVTAEIIERAKCFVYAIPEHTPLTTFEEIKRVAFVTNFDQRDLIAFDTLIKEFKSFDFSVSFIHLATDDDAWNEVKLAGIKEYFEKQYNNLDITYDVIKEDHLLNNLDEYVEKNKIDVLCITNYRRNIFARLFNPSIARKMIFHAKTPILVIK